MPRNILHQITSTIEKHKMIPPNSKIAVALSGGADSVCLLVCLNELKDKYGAELFAVHINHMLRSNADTDEEFVAELCNKIGIPLAIHRHDVGKEAKVRGISEELAGRLIRYECFNKELEIRGGSKAALIATGHNKNDNAETVFMNIIRGTGMQGLCGIPPVRDNIIRPLIEIERSEITEFLHERGIKYRTDETNAQDIYARNKIRNSVFPFIEQSVNASLTSNLCRLSEIVKTDNDFLEHEAKRCYDECKSEKADMPGGVNIARFNQFHSAVKRRIIMLLYAEAAGSRNDLEHVHIEAVLSICEKESGKSVNLPGGVVAKRSYGVLYMCKDDKENREFSYDLAVGQTLFIEELGKTVKMSLKNDLNDATNACTRAFNYDIMKDGIKIRNYKSGDKIYINTLGGHKKLSDYFTDNKIPQEKRRKTALLACGSDIIWILDSKGITNGKYISGSAVNADNEVVYISIIEHREDING